MYSFIFVDDEDLMRELFAGILDFESYGFELAQMCASGEEALDYLKKHPETALVLTDIKMGRMSGIDLCREIRSAGLSPEIVIVSGYGEFEYAQQAIRYDVTEYLLKPTSYRDLESLFKKLKLRLDKRLSPNGKSAENAPAGHLQLIDSAKEYIQEHYCENITLEDAARHISLNPSYFSRFFKQQTDCNFVDYVARLRIEKAKELLQDGTIKVYEAGARVGYKNTQYFYKLFKQMTGVTPSEFRSNLNRRESPR